MGGRRLGAAIPVQASHPWGSPSCASVSRWRCDHIWPYRSRVHCASNSFGGPNSGTLKGRILIFPPSRSRRERGRDVIVSNHQFCESELNRSHRSSSDLPCGNPFVHIEEWDITGFAIGLLYCIRLHGDDARNLERSAIPVSRTRDVP